MIINLSTLGHSKNCMTQINSHAPVSCTHTFNYKCHKSGMDPAGSVRGGGVYQSRVGVDQRYKYMGLGVGHGAGHHSPCDQTSNVQRSAV